MAGPTAAGGFPVQMIAVEGRGRGLFATRDIAAGETVLQEAPLMLIASPEYLPMVCSQCLRGLIAGQQGNDDATLPNNCQNYIDLIATRRESLRSRI